MQKQKASFTAETRTSQEWHAVEYEWVPSKWACVFLAFFFGGLGIDQFYMKQYHKGLAWLLVFIFSSWTVIVPIFMGMIGMLKAISYASYHPIAWQRTFGIEKKKV